MAKYNFSTVGATECNNYYLVRLYRKDNARSVKDYVLITPLDSCELVSFIKSRSCLHRFGLDVTFVKCSDEDEEAPRIGLNGLAFLLSGKGITPETIDVKFNGRVYNVDVDKYAKFLESMQ